MGCASRNPIVLLEEILCNIILVCQILTYIFQIQNNYPFVLLRLKSKVRRKRLLGFNPLVYVVGLFPSTIQILIVMEVKNINT